MRILDFFRGKKGKVETEVKEETSPDKYINSEIEVVRDFKNTPRFNREVAVQSYMTSGLFAAAIDINVNAASNGCLRLYARTSKNGQKNRFKTKSNPDKYQKEYMKGLLSDKPGQEVLCKILNCDEDFEIVTNHPVSELFAKANPLQSPYQFFSSIYLNLWVTGDAYIHVVSLPDGKPSQLYVLQSQDVEVVPGKKGSGQLVSGYKYKENKGQTVWYPEDEIIHIKTYNPDSIWYGRGVIQKGWESYQLNKFSHEYQIALYQNDAVPSYLLINKSGNSISKKRFWKAATNLNRGPRRKGNGMAVDGDVEIRTVAFAPKDLSDITFTVQEIAAVTGVPLNKLVGNDQTKANTQGQDLTWLRQTIMPMMKTVASSLSENLLKRYNIEDGDAFLAYDSIVEEDREQRRLDHESWVKNAIKSPDEIRAELGMDERGNEADILYFNGNKLGENKNLPNPVPEKAISDDNNIIKSIESKNDEMKEKIDTLVSDLMEKQVKEERPPISINIGNQLDVIEEVVDDTTEKGII